MRRRGIGAKNGFWFLLLLAVPALLHVYVAKPAMDEAERAERLLEQRRAELGAQAEDVRRAEDAEPLMAYRLAQVRARVPEEPYPERILRDVELWQTAAGVTVRWVQIGPDDGASDAGGLGPLPDDIGAWFTPVRVTIALQGRYGQVERLLRELETMDRLYQVDRMALSAAEPAQRVAVHLADRLLDGELSVLTYYAPVLLEHDGRSPEIESLPPGERLHPFS